MRTLVTGGAGLIGSHIVDLLLAKGHRVRVFDNLEPSTHLEGKPDWVPKDVEFIHGDMRNIADVERAVTGVDVVFHQAAYGGFAPELTKMTDTNACGTARIFEVIRTKRLDIAKVVTASSQAVYGEGKYACDTCGPCHPDPRPIAQMERGDWEVRCPTCGAPTRGTYHMARVMHLVQDRSVAHYPTNILRQLYQPPWAEYALLQFQILSGGDRFANLVQWFSMVGSLVGASLIARQLGADHRGQALAAAVAATIPMGILQGSSTQNDYVEAFWLVCLTHYVLQSTRRASRTNACAVGASLALAVLTKGTAYLYAIPLLVWWAAATVRQWRSSAWQPAVIVVVVALSVNAGLYARNLELWGNPLGIGGSNPYAIGMVGVRVLASNAVRAIGLQLGTPSGRLNRVIDRGVRALHVPLRLDVNDPRTTMRDSPFVIRYSLLDDLAGSPLHLALVVMALVLVPASPERRRTRVTYAIALVGVALVFCGLLRCGAMNNRLLLPLFVLASPLVAVTLQERARGAVVLGVVGVLVGAAIPDLVRNETRPLVGIGPEGTVLGTPRLVQLLKRHTDLRDDYMGAAEFVGRLGCADVGLVIGDIDLEYPWWVLLHGTVGQPPRIEHVNVKNVSAVTETRKPFVDFAPCAVIVMDADRISWVLAEQANYTQAWIGDKGRAYRQGWSSGTVRVFVRR